MAHELAIVIPAFKKEFLRETLASIADQTCKAFRLYIGEDASPDDLFSIISEFKDKIEFTYKRFSENLGANDLVAHWSRCIELIRGEEWVWLFSDDDVMEPDCVEQFYACLQVNSETDLFHFNINVIDHFSRTIKVCRNFPQNLTAIEYFSKRINFKLNSTVVEFIFRKSIYMQEAGFKKYDLAWCSDDATWIKFAQRGIATVPKSKVYWRYSGSNISSNIQDKAIVLRKLRSSISHISWVTSYFAERKLADTTTHFAKFRWAISVVVLTSSFSFREKYQLVLQVVRALGYSTIALPAVFYLIYWHVRKKASFFKAILFPTKVVAQ